ncbi:MAG: hypothetical protein KF763_14830 [Cyclobacteriaceae bacterium]|nr:hypothetical protein [Cyclobacteriaceae bacterium]
MTNRFMWASILKVTNWGYPRRRRFLEGVLTYWGVGNVETEFERILSLGAAIHEKPANVGGEIVVATLLDP